MLFSFFFDGKSTKILSIKKDVTLVLDGYERVTIFVYQIVTYEKKIKKDGNDI